MIRQILFALSLLVTVGIFAFTVNRFVGFFKVTKPAYPIKDFRKRFLLMMEVAFGQTKIFRKPLIGLAHALVFWGFCVILIGSIEMVIDGLLGVEKSLKILGLLYQFITATGDIFALVIAMLIVVFLARRLFGNIKRFEGVEMKKWSHRDANIALSLILFLMISLSAMNVSYVAFTFAEGAHLMGKYPVAVMMLPLFSNMDAHTLWMMHETSWWVHILLIFFFANYLPYSKHFHVYLSVPNVFLTRLEPLGKLPNMDSVTREVKAMMEPETAFQPAAEPAVMERFGVKDIEDATWKNYFDSLSCTQCGRCTSVCPANITGKRLSPRKVMMDIRARMEEKGPFLVKDGKAYQDNKSLLRDYISEEEVWACTTCNACAKECPININHPAFIVDLRRYLVMEEASAPGELKSVFNNIENNGAPWQYSAEDRLNWAQDVAVMSDLYSRGEKAEYLFWVGCAGAFDDRYKKVVRAFAKILTHAKVSFAVLGKEESCTGDPARRAGNEMLYQMQALQVIETLKSYDVKRIVTICPHCYNIFKNEYPDLGGVYEVVHYLQMINRLMDVGTLHIEQGVFKDIAVTYHDPCYLGRANNMYDEPRSILKKLTNKVVEMESNRSFALCCGAGGAQMFKEAEKGDKEIYMERTEQALQTDAKIITTSCPFCMTMLTDGLKYKNREEEIKNLDIAELIVQSLKL